MIKKQHVRTVFISDIHLWNPKNQSNRLIEFLKTLEFENLVIIWDFLDYWQLNRFWLRREKEKNTLEYINKLSGKRSKLITLSIPGLKILVREKLAGGGDIKFIPVMDNPDDAVDKIEDELFDDAEELDS